METNTKITENLYNQLSNAAISYRDLCNNAESSSDELKAAKKAMSTAQDNYNRHIAEEFYRQCVANDGTDAVKSAIMAFYVPGAKKATVRQDKKTGAYKAIIGELDNYQISLSHMSKIIGAEYFHRADWLDVVNAMAWIMVCDVEKQFTGDISGTLDYEISEAAKTFQFGKGANISSNTSATKMLQQVVDAIIFIPTQDKKGNELNIIKMRSSDYAYIRECLTREGKKPCELIVHSTENVERFVLNVIHKELDDNVKFTLSSDC